MEKTEIQKYAELIISMSTEYLLGKITKEHYIVVLELTVKEMKMKP